MKATPETQKPNTTPNSTAVRKVDAGVNLFVDFSHDGLEVTARNHRRVPQGLVLPLPLQKQPNLRYNLQYQQRPPHRTAQCYCYIDTMLPLMKVATPAEDCSTGLVFLAAHGISVFACRSSSSYTAMASRRDYKVSGPSCRRMPGVVKADSSNHSHALNRSTPAVIGRIVHSQMQADRKTRSTNHTCIAQPGTHLFVKFPLTYLLLTQPFKFFLMYSDINGLIESPCPRGSPGCLHG